MSYDFVENDTGGKLRVTCKSAQGAAIDLTGATITLKWRKADGQLETKPMSTVGAASGGIAEYQFAAAELFAPVMRCAVMITDASGYELSSLDHINLKIRKRLPAL